MSQQPAKVIHGDCLEVLRTLPSGSAQTCVTSPPYYGLRDYGEAGQIGLEETPAEYVTRLVQVFREVRRVLKDDGTLWLNIGDSYGGNKGSGVKQKDLIGIPWMLAFALRADGWYLRQDIIWHKTNAMPESVKDRCTNAHEYVFLLSKSSTYFYNPTAIAEESTGQAKGASASFKRSASKRAEVIPNQTVGTHRADRADVRYNGPTRNRRTIWSIATRPFREAHSATMPPELARLCILAGSRPGDTVLDPFMGAYTTAYVALQEGRQAVGAELNLRYIEIGERRIRPLLEQPALLGAS